MGYIFPVGNGPNKFLTLTKIIFGILDTFTLGMIRRHIPNTIVFHEVSDSPSYFSKRNHTNIKTKCGRKIINQFAQKRIANLGYHHNIVFTFDDGFLSSVPYIEHLCEINAEVIIFLNSNTVVTGISEDEREFGVDLRGFSSNKMTLGEKSSFLNKEQIVSLHNRYPNLEIGDHLHKHLDSSTLSEIEFVEYLKNSKIFFNSFGVCPKSFAWPYGSENLLFLELLSRFGFEKVYRGGLRSPQGLDLFRLPRAQALQTPFPTLYIRGALLLNRLLSRE